MQDITADQLQAYLVGKMPDWSKVRVDNLYRLPLGASRETYRFDLGYADASGDHAMKVILRRDPPASLVDSDRRMEFLSYQSIYGHGIPVPKMLLLEEDPRPLDGAISLAEDLRGFHNSEYQLQQPEWAGRLPRISQECWGYMGKLGALDITPLNLESFMRPATVDSCAVQELERNVEIFRRESVGPDPVIEAAIRKLRRNPPRAQKLAMVHGDWRAGNFLYDDEGKIHAILDWEMAHIGDPLEDLAWSINRAFCFGKDERRGGLATREEAVRIWQESSGLDADPEALAWWELFSCVKAQALWVSAASCWANGTNREIILAYAPWWLRNLQDRAALEIMERL